MAAPSAPLIRLERIDKFFGPVPANRQISLDIHAGRIKALLGENGAGKSTLMGILAGQLRPDGGRMWLEGRPVTFSSTKAALAAGVGMVYQHFMLVEGMSVAENILMGQEPGFWLSPGKMRAQVARLAAAYGLSVAPEARVADLSMGERQRVEILKLLLRQSRVLIFDEPTAVLTPEEAVQLFAALRQMARQGKAILFISHKLGEVMALADEIAILRRGEIVDEVATAQVASEGDLADVRFVVGGIFTGYTGRPDGYMGLFQTSLTLLPEGDRREFLALINPGLRKLSYSRAFLSSFHPALLDTDCNLHGGLRACIACGHCNDVCPVDILPQLTYKAVLADEFEEYLALGLLDCVECGLCSYVCPSKIEVAAALRDARAAYYRQRE